MPEPLEWSAERIRQARAHGPIPSFGSAEWDLLPAGDPRRWAAVIVAAECWRDHRSPQRIADALRQEIADENAALYRRIRGASWDVAGARGWVAQSRRLTHAELQARRAS